MQIVQDTLRRFEEGGVLFDTAADAETLLVRPRTVEDNPVPAGQSVLALALLRVAAVTGEARWREHADMIMGPLAAVVSRSPLAISALACAIDRAQAPPREVAICGPVDDQGTRRLVDIVHARWSPNLALAWGEADIALLADRPLVNGQPTAYVCERFTCNRPVTDPDELAAQLD